MPEYRGSCVCGGVAFSVQGKLRPVIACHCSQCRKTSGHFVAATACRENQLSYRANESLAWYSAVPGFKRGFCNHCGSSLFFTADNGDRLSIAAGAFDQDLDLTIAAHIYCHEKGSYYEVDDATPTYNHGNHGIELP